MGAISIAGLLLAASFVEAASPTLRLVDSVSCPNRSEVKAALGRESIAVYAPGDESNADVVMEVSSTQGGHLLVRLTERSRHLSTEAILDPRGTGCVELARTAALLAESWFLDRPSFDPLTSPSVTIAAFAPSPPTADLRPEVPAVTQDLPAPVLRHDPPRLSLSAAMELIASGAVGIGGDFGAEVTLWTPLSIGLRVSLLPALSGQDGQGGTVTVQRQSGALFLALTLVGPAERTPSLAVLAGAVLLHASSQEQGFPQVSNESRWQAGGLLGVRGIQPLGEVLFAYGEVDGQVVPDALQFQAGEQGPAPPTTLVTQPGWWLSVSFGAGARFF